MSKYKYVFKVNRIVPCDGSSIWMDSNEVRLKVTEIKIECTGYWGDPYPTFYVWVKHNGPWYIYTDRGFEKGISEIISKKIGEKISIVFTEQGMQDNHKASMESNRTGDKTLFKFFKRRKILPSSREELEKLEI